MPFGYFLKWWLQMICWWDGWPENAKKYPTMKSWKHEDYFFFLFTVFRSFCHFSLFPSSSSSLSSSWQSFSSAHRKKNPCWELSALFLWQTIIQASRWLNVHEFGHFFGVVQILRVFFCAHILLYLFIFYGYVGDVNIEFIRNCRNHWNGRFQHFIVVPVQLHNWILATQVGNISVLYNQI